MEGVKLPGNEAKTSHTYGLQMQTTHKLSMSVNYTPGSARKTNFQNDLSGLTLTRYFLWLDWFPGNSWSCPLPRTV